MLQKCLKHNSNNKIKFTKYDGKKLPYPNEYFDRIIISHCLEHILSPEEFIIEMMSKLKKGGVLSIALPTDPGILWRLGRMFIRLFSIKKLTISQVKNMNILMQLSTLILYLIYYQSSDIIIKAV